jgi:hypothetical protein
MKEHFNFRVHPPMRRLSQLILPVIAIVPGLYLQAAPPSSPWPPESMRHLAPDYIERMRASLNVGKERLKQKTLENSTSKDSIGWVRYGQPSLLIGERTDEINAFFASDKFEWTANPKFGFSLFGTSYMRLYAMGNPRNGKIPSLLTEPASRNFEKEMWRVAKANSKLAEASRPVWQMEGSENHHISSKSGDLLAMQFLRRIPEYAGQKLDDGSTLEQQYEVRLAYWLKWFDERAKYGQFIEAASPSYQGDSVAALFNLRDFAEDEILRRKADMYLDLAFAVMAEETLLTTRGGPKSRVKVGHEYDGGMASERSYNLMFNAPGRTFTPLGENTLTTSSYSPPPAVLKLAQDTTGRGTYSFATRWPGPVAEGGGRSMGDPDGRLWRTLDPQRSVVRRGFCTPGYVLGSAALDPRWLDDTSMGFRWQGMVFADDPLSRIGFEVLPAKRKDWHGFNPFFSIQDRNVLITQKWVPIPPNPPTANPSYLRIYFSPTLDLVQEEGGWIFAKGGNAFAAVKVVAGGYQWTPAWQHADTITEETKAFVTLDTENAPVILIANDASDYGGSFDAFKSAIKARPVQYADGAVKFETLTFYGPAMNGLINGEPVNLTPARGYDSPFIRSEWGSGLIHIRKGDDTLVLDFRDPKNPTKTLKPADLSAFPPGAGATPPIVSGNAVR